jgi:hypothetical protein
LKIDRRASRWVIAMSDVADHHGEDREGEDVVTNVAPWRSDTEKNRNHCNIEPVTSITTITAPMKMALSFWPGLNLSASSGERPRVLEPTDLLAGPGVDAVHVAAHRAAPGSEQRDDDRDREGQPAPEVDLLNEVAGKTTPKNEPNRAGWR